MDCGWTDSLGLALMGHGVPGRATEWARAAEQSGKFARVILNPSYEDNVIDRAEWVLVTSNPEFFSRLVQANPIAASSRPWTDDYSNLWQALK